MKISRNTNGIFFYKNTLDTVVSTAVPGIIKEMLVVEATGSMASLSAFGSADRTTSQLSFTPPLILVTLHRITLPTSTVSEEVEGCCNECGTGQWWQEVKVASKDVEIWIREF